MHACCGLEVLSSEVLPHEQQAVNKQLQICRLGEVSLIREMSVDARCLKCSVRGRSLLLRQCT